ncbi:transposase [Moniliophthora roreri MCA 2997]|uniref:Transposase n=1 Tax=Moniliophthora roreri (strain MCA 2997) TaxID=1381753 RepID=V2WL79_MONRO|nr:transposase [Moniliophthora roreri MCA 2997]
MHCFTYGLPRGAGKSTKKTYTPCSPTKRRLITFLHEEQFMKYSDIADVVGVNASTTCRNYHDMNITRDPYKRAKPGRGRPKKVSAQELCEMVRGIDDRSIWDGADAGRTVCPQVPDCTVRQTLEQAGLYGHVRRKKPHLMNNNLCGWVEFGLKMLDLDKEEWHLAVFSDEKKLTVFNGDGHRYCRRRVDEALEPSKLQKMVPHGGGSIIVWGCLTPYGPGRLVRIEGTMTGKKYTEVLEEGYLGTLGDYGIPHNTPDLLFQQDYDPKHTSKTAAD